MNKPRLILLSSVLVFGMLVGPESRSAKAIPPFMDGFYDVYLKPDSQDAKDKAYVSLVQGAKCNLCHQGKSRKDRNPYGAALAQLLNRKTDKDNKEKIHKALLTVAAKKVDPTKADSPTFGDLISQGKLPGGNPKPARAMSANTGN